MVRRSIPLGRRLWAVRGQIFLAIVWFGALLTSAVLLLLSPGTATRTAVAVIRTWEVRAPESGRISEVNVSPEQRVEAGAVLATVEVPGLAQQIASATAKLKAIEAEMAAKEADRGRKFAGDLDDARTKWLAARVQLERDRALLDGLDREITRMQAPGVALSTAEMETKQTARNAAKASVDAREQEVDALNRAYEAARTRAGAVNDAALKASLEAATVELEGLKMRMDANVLRASAGGVVNDMLPAAGQWVQAGMPVVTLTEPSTHDAVVYVDVAVAHQLTPGGSISVLDEGGRRNDATIRSIGVAVQEVPPRQLREVARPEWGVPVTLQVADRVLTPGEALAVEF
jgi:multidrug resistance efflux pump